LNRTPIILSLVGLGVFLFGIYMMLRVLVSPFDGGMSESGSDPVAILRQSAWPDVMSTYIFMTASGFAIFAAGLAMLFGRMRG
jgi:hypothetical protein